MPNYDPVEYWLYIPKLIDTLCFFITGLIIYRKKKYIINKLFGFAMWSWNIYTISDLIIWTHGADSEFMLQVVNVIRDIQIFAAITVAFLVYLISRIIAQSLKAINKRNIILIGMIFYIIATLLASRESLHIEDAQGNILAPSEWNSVPMVIVVTDLDLLFGMLMLTPVILYYFSIKNLNDVKKNIKDSLNKKRINRLIIGFSLLPIGLIYFATILGLGIVTNAVFYFFLGRAIWISSSLFILSSQIEPKNKTNNNN